MDYSVQCSCGRQLPVAAAQAGSTIQCVCTRDVSVPRLSELREAAGQGAFEAGIIDTIRRMMAEGELPWGNTCALTGQATDDVLEVRVECERMWHRGPGKASKVFGVFSLLFFPCWPIWALLCWAIFREKSEILGHDTVVHVPLRACDAQHDRVRQLSQRRLRRLLRAVPVYAKLFEEYPWAKVCVVDRQC